MQAMCLSLMATLRMRGGSTLARTRRVHVYLDVPAVKRVPDFSWEAYTRCKLGTRRAGTKWPGARAGERSFAAEWIQPYLTPFHTRTPHCLTRPQAVRVTRRQTVTHPQAVTRPGTGNVHGCPLTTGQPQPDPSCSVRVCTRAPRVPASVGWGQGGRREKEQEGVRRGEGRF